MSILKVDMTIVPLFYLIYYSLVPKIEICLKYFLDKKFPKAAIVIHWLYFLLTKLNMSLLPKKALKKLVKSVSEAKGIVYYFYLHHNGLKTLLK